MPEGIVGRLRALQPLVVVARLRQSLFAIPTVCLLAGVVLADILIRADRADWATWLPGSYETSAENGRTVLGAIATGTITVVTLVLTLTLIAIQLASGQLSPRTIANFLGDRFQQWTVGVVLGTAGFSLLALRAIEVGEELGPSSSPDVTVLVGVVLTVASLMMLVVSVDRTANRLAVGTLIDDIATETCALIERLHGDEPERDGPAVESDWQPVSEIETDNAGWVQRIDETSLADALSEGAAARLMHPVGSFVLPGMVLVELDSEPVDEDAADSIRRSFRIGDHRTVEQDVAFGLTRLSDIALRALSPGVNDPNTAREVVVRIGQVVLVLQALHLPSKFVEIEGRRIERKVVLTHDSFVGEAFDQIRYAAGAEPSVLDTLRRVLVSIADETRRRNLPGSVEEVERQRRLVELALADIDRWTPDSGAGGHVVLP